MLRVATRDINDTRSVRDTVPYVFGNSSDTARRIPVGLELQATVCKVASEAYALHRTHSNALRCVNPTSHVSLELSKTVLMRIPALWFARKFSFFFPSHPSVLFRYWGYRADTSLAIRSADSWRLPRGKASKGDIVYPFSKGIVARRLYTFIKAEGVPFIEKQRAHPVVIC